MYLFHAPHQPRYVCLVCLHETKRNGRNNTQRWLRVQCAMCSAVQRSNTLKRNNNNIRHWRYEAMNGMNDAVFVHRLHCIIACLLLWNDDAAMMMTMMGRWVMGWWVSTTCSLLYSNNNRKWMNTLNTLETTQFRLVRVKEKETHTTIRRCHLLVVQCSRRSRIAISSTFEKWHVISPSVRPSNRTLFAVYSRNLLRIITHLLCLYWI